MMRDNPAEYQVAKLGEALTGRMDNMADTLAFAIKRDGAILLVVFLASFFLQYVYPSNKLFLYVSYFPIPLLFVDFIVRVRLAWSAADQPKCVNCNRTLTKCHDREHMFIVCQHCHLLYKKFRRASGAHRLYEEVPLMMVWVGRGPEVAPRASCFAKATHNRIDGMYRVLYAPVQLRGVI
jgi:hypothetical protein